MIFDQLIVLSAYIDSLKGVERRIWSSRNMKESVADHSWGLCVLIMFCYPHLDLKIDFSKMLKMALIHDIGEVIAGDVPFSKIVEFPELKKKKKKDEFFAIREIARSLEESLGREMFDLWVEYENGQTIEGATVKALDKVEAQLQQLTSDVSRWGNPRVIASAWISLEKICSFNGFLHSLAMDIIQASYEKIENSEWLNVRIKEQILDELNNQNSCLCFK